jgi:hypothetical protein
MKTGEGHSVPLPGQPSPSVSHSVPAWPSFYRAFRYTTAGSLGLYTVGSWIGWTVPPASTNDTHSP